MDLSKEAVTEYKELYKKEFGIELSQEEAQTQARNFLRHMSVVVGKRDIQGV